MVVSKSNVTFFIGSDHRGFKLKEQIKEFLVKQDIQFKDCGNTIYKKDDDYPDYAKAVAKQIQKALKTNQPAKGILLCGSAEGMVIAANKFKAIRAALTTSKEQTILAVKDDHINVICIPANTSKITKSKSIILAFLKAKTSQAKRHLRRIKKINQIEKNNFKRLL